MQNFINSFVVVVVFRVAPTAYRGPRLGVKSELQLLAYTTATATQDPSSMCDLYHSARQHQILLNPLREARDRTPHLTAPRQIRFHCATTGAPELH